MFVCLLACSFVSFPDPSNVDDTTHYYYSSSSQLRYFLTIRGRQTGEAANGRRRSSSLSLSLSCFLLFWVLCLSRKGVFVCVCSKEKKLQVEAPGSLSCSLLFLLSCREFTSPSFSFLLLIDCFYSYSRFQIFVQHQVKHSFVLLLAARASMMIMIPLFFFSLFFFLTFDLFRTFTHPSSFILLLSVFGCRSRVPYFTGYSRQLVTVNHVTLPSKPIVSTRKTVLLRIGTLLLVTGQFFYLNRGIILHILLMSIGCPDTNFDHFSSNVLRFC